MKQIFNRIFLVLTGIFFTLILVGCDQGTNEKKQYFTEENSEEGSVEPQSFLYGEYMDKAVVFYQGGR